MNSYEPRLNELKRLTTQLDNKELISDIDNFALRWNETYSLISKFKFILFIHFSNHCVFSLFIRFYPILHIISGFI